MNRAVGGRGVTGVTAGSQAIRDAYSTVSTRSHSCSSGASQVSRMVSDLSRVCAGAHPRTPAPTIDLGDSRDTCDTPGLPPENSTETAATPIRGVTPPSVTPCDAPRHPTCEVFVE